MRAWQIWNEPNIVNYWSVQPFMRGYARLLSSAYAAVKGADRGATVVMAGLANYSWRDLSRLYRKGGRKLRFDVAAVHPFSGRPSNSVKIVRLNRDVLNRNGASKRPIWLTELTWSSAKGRKTPITKDWETTEAGQAQRLREAFGLFIKARRRCGSGGSTGTRGSRSTATRPTRSTTRGCARCAPTAASRTSPRRARSARSSGSTASSGPVRGSTTHERIR